MVDVGCHYCSIAYNVQMSVLVKIATRNRGFEWMHKFVNQATLPDTNFLISMDHDDPQTPPDLPNVTIVRGHTDNKIHAMNRDINEYQGDWQMVIVASDDMHPEMKGYDEFLLNELKRKYQDLDGCIWIPTEDSKKEKRNGHQMIPGSIGYYRHWISMLPIMGKKYYERFNYVYHPSYVGFWCDNEQTEVARRLGRIHFVNNMNVIQHWNPSWDPRGKIDNLYSAYDMKIFRKDQQTYSRRISRNFPPESI